MRRVARLIALGVVMALLHHLTAAGAVAARAALALGFLLIAAWLGADLAERARLPRIVGFLVLGFAAGPAWLGFVRPDELAALGFISDACVAVVALAAGTELSFAALRADRVPLARVAGGTIVLPFAVVALVTLSVSPWFPVTVHEGLRNAIGVAGVLGAVACVSSPVVTVAVLAELRAHGPFARTVLGATVVRDVAGIALVVLVLAVVRPLASAGAVDAGVAWATLARLGGSIAAGAVLAALLAGYARLVRDQATPLLGAFAFTAALAARALPVVAALAALTAGIGVASGFPPEAERLRATLRRGAEPVVATVFALAGASFRADALVTLWPWVLLFVALRAVTLRYGTLWAGRHAAVSPALAREGWLGLVSQGGGAVLLAATARQAFPAWGVSLEALILAMVVVHEVLGPLALRRALASAGELGRAEAEWAGPRGVAYAVPAVPAPAVWRDAEAMGERRQSR